MAKSLRSKSKLKAKSVKRKGEFAEIVGKRHLRIAERLAEETKKQVEKEGKGEKSKEKNGEVDMMDVAESSDKPKVKISTSGWRDTSRQKHKQKRMKKNKVMKH